MFTRKYQITIVVAPDTDTKEDFSAVLGHAYDELREIFEEGTPRTSVVTVKYDDEPRTGRYIMDVRWTPIEDVDLKETLDETFAAVVALEPLAH